MASEMMFSKQTIQISPQLTGSLLVVITFQKYIYKYIKHKLLIVWLMNFWAGEQSVELEGLLCTLPVAAI